MSRVAIDNKKDTFVPAMHQTLEKFYKHRSPYSLWGDHESKLTFGADCRNHVERKSLPLAAWPLPESSDILFSPIAPLTSGFAQRPWPAAFGNSDPIAPAAVPPMPNSTSPDISSKSTYGSSPESTTQRET